MRTLFAHTSDGSKPQLSSKLSSNGSTSQLRGAFSVVELTGLEPVTPHCQMRAGALTRHDMMQCPLPAFKLRATFQSVALEPAPPPHDAGVDHRQQREHAHVE
jgi:hypothetical protein